MESWVSLAIVVGAMAIDLLYYGVMKMEFHAEQILILKYIIW
jgi:hypothetical protein